MLTKRQKDMHSAKMFMRGKLIKFGYKCCCLCSLEGYLFNFNPYFWKDADQSNESLGIRVINILIEVLPTDETKNFELIFNDFFTSMEIMTILKDRKIKDTGTI